MNKKFDIFFSDLLKICYLLYIWREGEGRDHLTFNFLNIYLF